MFDKKTRLLQLSSVKNVGRLAIKSLIDHFNSVENIFDADPLEISRVAGLDINSSDKIVKLKESCTAAVFAELEKIEKLGCRVYCYGEGDYPKLLRETYDPPILIYSNGEIKDEDYNAVAIVGTRKASEYGRNAARLIAKKLAANNITVVSGCAVGIDTAAHEGVLENGGRTIAVLGSGLCKKYPVENIRLMERIESSGAVISEFSTDTDPEPFNFPQRNRIISGLSLCVIVVEAPLKSGALITAYQAVDQGRDVYAVPGSMFSSNSAGSNALIKKGAIPVTDPDEIIRELEPILDKALVQKREREFAESKVSDEGRKLLSILDKDPVHIDMLKSQTKISINMLAKELTGLEIMGRIKQVGGKRYIKNG